MDEAETCRAYVRPRLEAAGWDDELHPIIEQKTFTDGRIVPLKRNKVKRLPPKRADYLLHYTRDFPLAVVEAKAVYKLPADGLQQAKNYAEMLGLKFAYATNGQGIVEYDYFSGMERELEAFPSPGELWSRLRVGQGLDDAVADKLLTPSFMGNKKPRYYQQIAIDEALKAMLKGQQRMLLTMATGTGKTMVAFQICWKLWNARWNIPGQYRRPRILYLSDRNILVDDPMFKEFAAFDREAVNKIENGQVTTSREIYFAIYQAIARDTNRPGLYREFKRDFFDLVIVDECHRGSADDESNWREILEYFESAYQLGMTATPKRDDNVDTYRYFGDPVYTYSLSQGIDDGFLAPYRVYRVMTSVDAAGWRPAPGQLDRHGRVIPEQDYTTPEFERKLALRQRTRAIARHLTEFLKKNGRLDKTIVFCVDQEHADEMRRELANLNSDLMQGYPDYVCRVTSDERDIGRGHLSHFQDVETASPAILTTSHLLTTGVDVPTCKNVVLARVINSMTEFKQIIGRGTRVRDDYGKYYFNILDYTGSATRLFADPSFDGDPVRTTEVTIDADGEPLEVAITQQDEHAGEGQSEESELPIGEESGAVRERTKYYYDDGKVEIVADAVYELDADGNRLRMVKLTDYTAERVRSLYPNAAALRIRWANPDHRREIIDYLEDKGITFQDLAAAINQPDADPFDLLCYIVFSTPLRTRRERASAVHRQLQDAFKDYREEARAILDALLEKYAVYGVAQFTIPDVFDMPFFSQYGNILEIGRIFGGTDRLRHAVQELQALLYAA
jgi:type I restriction enzyme R subunit